MRTRLAFPCLPQSSHSSKISPIDTQIVIVSIAFIRKFSALRQLILHSESDCAISIGLQVKVVITVIFNALSWL